MAGHSLIIRFGSMTFVAIVAFTVLLILPSTPVFAAKCSASANPGVNWSDCRKRNIILTRSDLSGATLQGTDFSATDLSRSQMGGSDLTKATIVRASFAGTYADNAVFERSVGSRTNFQEASLKSATFYKAEMPRANFTGAALNDVNFDHSDLGRADFTDADITGTRFEFSILARADLRGSRFEGPIDFTGAYFFLTRIEGVDLSAAEGLAQWQIDMACGDDDTKLPDGVSRPGSWPCSMDW